MRSSAMTPVATDVSKESSELSSTLHVLLCLIPTASLLLTSHNKRDCLILITEAIVIVCGVDGTDGVCGVCGVSGVSVWSEWGVWKKTRAFLSQSLHFHSANCGKVPLGLTKQTESLETQVVDFYVLNESGRTPYSCPGKQERRD